MDKPIPEAVVDAGVRAAVEASDARLPRYRIVRAILEAAFTAAQQQGQAVASLEGFREPVTLWGKAYEYDRHGRDAVIERRKPIVDELLAIIETAIAQQPAVAGLDPPVERQRDMLAQAIRDAAVKAGIARADADMTGPMLLMLCNDLADCALATQHQEPTT